MISSGCPDDAQDPPDALLRRALGPRGHSNDQVPWRHSLSWAFRGKAEIVVGATTWLPQDLQNIHPAQGGMDTAKASVLQRKQGDQVTLL